MREYELNSEVKWTLTTGGWPEVDRPVFILIEEDTCDPRQYPGILKVVLQSDRRMRLVDFDPETQEEFLNQNVYGVIAWRYMTNHAGTWDGHLDDDD